MRATKLLFAILAASVCAAATADGMYFGKEGLDAKPTIPTQRAFLAHRNGEETLIVESALDAPPGEYAWVVPVPSVPKVDASTAGALKTLDQLTPPKIDRIRQPLNNYLIFFAAAIVVLAISAPHRLAEKRYRASRLAVEIVFAAFLSLCLAMFLPKYAYGDSRYAFESSKSAAPDAGALRGDSSVVEHASGDVGSYSYSVVSSTDVGDLLEWLKTNQFVLPSDAKPAIEGYVKKSWKFFAAKLRHEGGANKPHPVRLVFATKEPVYPMALTSAVGGDIVLDLYVVGDGQADVRGMKVWRSSLLKHQVTAASSYVEEPPAGTSLWSPVGHPELTPAFWEGAVLTRLRGEFGARSLSDDLAVKFDKFTADYRAELVTNEVARDVAWLWALLGFCVVLVPPAAWVIESKPTPGPMWLVLVVALAVGAVIGVGKYRSTGRVAEGVYVYDRAYEPGPRSRAAIVEMARMNMANRFASHPEKALLGAVYGPKEDIPGGRRIQRTPSGYRLELYDAAANLTKMDITEQEMQPPARPRR